MTPLSFEFELKDFDVGILPVAPDLLRGNESLLRKTIREYLTDLFKRLGGKARISSYDNYVRVEWSPVSPTEDWHSVMVLALDLLRDGAFKSAEPILRALERQRPDECELLLNYGMMLSDQGRFDEAIPRLKRVVSLDPNLANAWVALGVALARQNKESEATVVLEKALELEPDNAYALKNLGGITSKNDPSLGLEYLKRAVEILPDDQQALYGYALCLLHTDNIKEADDMFKRAIAADEFSELAEACRKARTQIAHQQMRSNLPGKEPQMDVVMYCLAALQAFERMGTRKMQQTTMEIAMLGRSGLDINDPEQKYSIRSIGGKFSGRQLLAYMYVGLNAMNPQLDTGVDFSKELAMAKSLHKPGAAKKTDDEH